MLSVYLITIFKFLLDLKIITDHGIRHDLGKLKKKFFKEKYRA